MNTTYFLTVKGSKQGDLVGEGGPKANARGIPILGYTLGVAVPHSAGSGQATGKRVYEPVGVYKIAGPATPQLFQALVTGELLPKVTISTYTTGNTGKESLYFTITLTNAFITGLEHEPGEEVDRRELEEIEFSFEKIELANLASGASAQDDLGRTA
jgi:type VI secretion system secreted protein Hcp